MPGVTTDLATITVVVVDDHALVRDSLRLLLSVEPDIEVVTEAGDVASAKRWVLSDQPTVVVLDLALPDTSGLDALPALLRRSPDTAVVVLTMHEDPAFAREAVREGALGYVLKQSAGADLVAAVRAAARGESWLAPTVGADLADAAGGAHAAPSGLTEREMQVLGRIALGHTNAEIAELLRLSVRTVESHRARIQQKTGRSTRAELVAYAFDHGLIE